MPVSDQVVSGLSSFSHVAELLAAAMKMSAAGHSDANWGDEPLVNWVGRRDSSDMELSFDEIDKDVSVDEGDQVNTLDQSGEPASAQEASLPVSSDWLEDAALLESSGILWFDEGTELA